MSQSGSINNGTGPGSGIVRTLTGDTGGPVGPDNPGNIDVIGAGGITVAGNPGTHTLTISDGGSASNFIEDVGFANPIGGTINILGSNNITTTGNGINTVTVELTEGLDGQILIAATSADAAWANITSLDSSITITNGPNSIDLSVASSGGTTTFDTDSGTATPTMGVIDISGGLNINTAGATNVVTINLDTSINLPDTNVGFTTGTLLLNSVPFLHNFGGTGGSGGLSGNVFLGENSGNDTLNTGASNIGIGSSSLSAVVDGFSNIAIGSQTLLSLDSGNSNIAIGDESLIGLNGVAGSNNIAIGVTAGANSNTTTANNVFIGSGSGNSVAGSTDNVAIGYTAMVNGSSNLTQSFNVAIGSQAFQEGCNNYNIGIGYQAGFNLGNIAGDSNIYISNLGVMSESNVIRIGTQGTGNGEQDACYVAGIYNTAIGATNQVTLIDNTGKLGSSTGDDGQVLIGATGGSPEWANITPGTNITITNAANSITINASTGGLAWNEITTSTVALISNNGYIMNNATGVTGTLPAISVVGDIIAIVGKNAGGWTVDVGTGQTIHFGSHDTTTSTGSLSSTFTYDSFEMVCITANTDWVVRNSIGNITYI